MQFGKLLALLRENNNDTNRGAVNKINNYYRIVTREDAGMQRARERALVSLWVVNKLAKRLTSTVICIWRPSFVWIQSIPFTLRHSLTHTRRAIRPFQQPCVRVDKRAIQIVSQRININNNCVAEILRSVEHSNSHTNTFLRVHAHTSSESYRRLFHSLEWTRKKRNGD